MKTQSVSVFASLAVVSMSAFAADWTVDSPTSFTGSATYDNIYVNADLTNGTEAAAGAITLNSSKYIYLPGSAGKNVVFSFLNGTVSPSGNSSGFKIGEYSGTGIIDVCGAPSGDATIGRVEVRGSAVAGSSGYVDFLKVNVGLSGSGHWNRICLTKILNYKTDSVPARILFTGRGGALRPNGSYFDHFFYCSNEGAKTVIEGDGADITFVNGPWFSNAKKIAPILQDNSSGAIRTQGDCDVVLHNHNAGLGLDYGFLLSHGTNRIQWAHTGALVVSNACVVKTTANYALPNGPQTGRIEFKARNDTSQPSIDLAGTVQIVNGIYSKVVQIDGTVMGFVTNSSGTAATLVLGAHGEDGDMRAGAICDNITLRKIGSGTLGVDVSRMDAIEVLDGVATVTNSSSAANSVVVDGGTLEIVGVRLLVSGSVVCRNGGRIVSVNGGVLDNRGTLEADSPNWFLMEFRGAAELSGAAAGTCPVRVSSGTTVVYDSDQDNKYWRVRLRDTQNDNTALYVYDGDTLSDVTTNVNVALQKFHLFNAYTGTPSSDSRLNAMESEAAVGTAPKFLAELQAVADKQYMTDVKLEYGEKDRIRLNAVGLVNGALGPLSSWQYNTAWATGALSEQDESSWVTIAMRLSGDTKPVRGYAYATSGWEKPGLNPRSFVVECSPDGENWVRKADVSGAYNGHYRHPSSYIDGEIHPLTNNCHGAFSTYGVVSVASGATLDLTGIPAENVAVNAIEYDWIAGGGTIAGFVPAETGALYLINVPAGASVYGSSLDLDVSGASKQRLRGWQVYANGKLCNSCCPKVNSDGRMEIVGSGFTLVFR